MRIRLTIISVLVSTASLFAATSFHTPRLEKIAKAVALKLPDNLGANMDYDGLATYNNRELRIRTNTFGDISHIGYRLFNLPDPIDDNTKADLPVFDFIERYLLELDLRLDGRSREQRMDLDQVVMPKGTMSLLYAITPETPFQIEAIPRRMFRFTWIINGQEVVLSFPASCQLILGANAIELELIAEKDIQRIIPMTSSDIINDWATAKVSKSQGLLVIEGESYVSELIRSDIFLKEENGTRTLLCDSLTPTKSISNIMLTGLFEREIPMTLRLNRYGHQVDTFETTLQQFISFCKLEGCQLFFGIKSIGKEELSGALFASNEKLGYNHLLSFVFPLNILKGEDQTVRGTSYVYIPLNQLEEEFFKQFKK